MDKKEFYHKAHLTVAAIRILEHQNGMPPAVDTLSSMLRFSLEESQYLCRKLSDLGIIDIVEGAYGMKLFVKNHLGLEDIPNSVDDSSLKEDLDKFMSSKKTLEKEIASIKAKQEKKQKDLFAEIDRKLKKSMDPKSS
ncbi:MAG: hypothetical protein R6U50_14060 [Desulfobacterales bacterium]